MSKPHYRLAILAGDAPSWQLTLSPVLAESLATSVATEQAPPTVLIRRQQPYVLLGPDDRRLPQLARGLSYLRGHSLPVFHRLGGGSAVLLDQGCLSFAVARPCRDLTLLHRNYHELAEGVLRGLRSLGLAAEFGNAPGSFCEGPYDIVVHGVKIAGVAQAIRRGFALVSGMILVHQDPEQTTSLLNTFYEQAGVPRSLTASAVTNLHQLLNRPVQDWEVEQALRHGFSEVFHLQEEPVRETEWGRAHTLMAERRADEASL